MGGVGVEPLELRVWCTPQRVDVAALHGALLFGVRDSGRKVGRKGHLSLNGLEARKGRHTKAEFGQEGEYGGSH